MASFETRSGSACERSYLTLSVQDTDMSFLQSQDFYISPDMLSQFEVSGAASYPSIYPEYLSELKDFLDLTLQNYILSMHKTSMVLEQAKQKLSAGLGISGILRE